MKPDPRDIDAVVRRYLPSASTAQTEAAGTQVLQRLRFKVQPAAVEDASNQMTLVAAAHTPWRPGVRIAAAAAVVIAVIGAAVMWRGESPEVANVVYGSLSGTARTFPYFQVVRADDAGGAMFSLADGTQVEMRSQAELSIERAADGLSVHLLTGDIIVNAAKQRDGHLYVHTKDMTVSVVGTVFLVNAEQSGSRVAVIDGEVRVKESTRETKLRPGEHVSTIPVKVPRITDTVEVAMPVREEIAWSRHADAHMALLHQSVPQTPNPSAVSPAPAAPQPQALPAPVADQSVASKARFEEASIRECDPDNPPPTPPGGRGGGANSLTMTPGRLYVQCMTLATLIRTAYGFAPAQLEFFNATEGPRRRPLNPRFDVVSGMGVEDGLVVRGAPEWVRETRYSIEAVGDATATPDVIRGAMLKELLERRFQLKAHVEAEQMPGYAMVVTPGGLKMKPFQTGDCVPTSEISDAIKAERARRGWTGPVLITEAAHFGIKPNCGVYGETNGPNYHFEHVGSEPGQVAGLVGRSLGVRVINRTNITDRFIYSWDFGIDEQTPGVLEELKTVKTWNPRPGWDSPMTIPKAPSIFTALEQLGLKLEPIRVPREFLVVDRAEPPSPN